MQYKTSRDYAHLLKLVNEGVAVIGKFTGRGERELHVFSFQNPEDSAQFVEACEFGVFEYVDPAEYRQHDTLVAENKKLQKRLKAKEDELNRLKLSVKKALCDMDVALCEFNNQWDRFFCEYGQEYEK